MKFISRAIFALLLSSHLGLRAAELPPAETDEVKAWAMLIQVMESVRHYVLTRELTGVHQEDMQLNQAASFILGEARRVQPDGAGAAGPILSFSRRVADLHAAADASDQTGAEARLTRMVQAFETLTAQCEPAVLARARLLAARFICPMHPAISGSSTTLCAKCGMQLDQPARLSLSANGGTPAQHTVRASITVNGSLERGKPASAVLQLQSIFGQPVHLEDLREVHTQKIHLLIVDASLTDYHHEHPTPTGEPGQYAFTFTPQKPGPYRAWADVRTTVTGLQEYAVAEITADTPPEPLADKTTRLHAEVDGLRYDLVVTKKIVAGEAVPLKMRITTANGEPFAALEPVMATFAHLVAFGEDRNTVLHLHPKGAPILTAEARGGPELEFQFWADQPGFYRLFAQVQIGGAQKFAPFGIEVAPAGAGGVETPGGPPSKTAPLP